MTAQLEVIERAFKSTGERGRALLKWRIDWLDKSRPKQLPPPGDWQYWLLNCGRGFGKTRLGAEDCAFEAATHPGWHAVVGPTQSDVRSICFEGPSGLMSVIPPCLVKRYNRNDLELELVGGGIIAGKSAEKPDRLRGPNWRRAWCDELASWGASAAGHKKSAEVNRLQETWDNLLFGLRIGERPRVVITTTPRPLQFIRDLARNPKTHLTTGSTFENTSLAKSALDTYREIFEGTRKGQQELYAEILEDAEGALWTWAQIEKLRVKELPDGVTVVRYVIAIDPAVTSEDQSDETGIVVAGLGSDSIIYVLDDLSGKYTPRDWARTALIAYSRREADCVVGEVNQGGDLVESNLRAEAGETWFRYKGVHAKRSKYLRAEPIAAYYEKGKVRHVGLFPQLEKQMVNFTGSTGIGSPDRLDALVYAIKELMSGLVTHDFF